MPLSPDFIDYAEELITGFSKVEIRKMFGGAGVYRNGVGFGILDDDTFFIKADTAFGAELKKQGSRPWSYSVKKDGTVRDIAYWSLPAAAADDGDEASALAKRSFEIAKRAAAEKAKKPKKAVKAAAKKAPPKKAAKKAAPKRKK
jgi:DNA transformation protein and related proteins